MIFFFGFAGSGKSLQGQKVVEKYGWKWLSAGQLLRDCNDPEITSVMNSGELVDDKLVSRIMHEAMLKEAEAGKHAIIDGYPRDLDQLQNILDYDDLKMIKGAVIFKVPKEELMKRMLARGRADDTEAAIEKRWAIFEEFGHKIVDVLRENGVRVAEVDGFGTPDEVSERVDAILAEWEMIKKEA